MKKKILHFILILLVITPLNKGYTEFTQQEIKEKVSEILTHRHPEDDKQWWQSLGENAPEVIIQMYQETTKTYHKTRLMGGLNFFSEPQVGEFIKNEIEKEQNKVLKNNAIKTLANSQGPKEAIYVAKFLKSEEERTRLAAAKALQKMIEYEGADEELINQARNIFENYKKNEKKQWIIEKLNKKKSTSLIKKNINRFTKIDLYNKELLGEWTGYWVTLDKSKNNLEELKVHPASLKVAKEGEKKIKGNLSVQLKDKVNSYFFENGLAKAKNIKGVFKLSRDQSSQIKFLGGMSREKKSYLLRLVAPSDAGTFVFYKKQN